MNVLRFAIPVSPKVLDSLARIRIPVFNFPSIPVFTLPNLDLPNLAPILQIHANMAKSLKLATDAAQRLDADLAALEPGARMVGECGWTLPMWGTMDVFKEVTAPGTEHRLDELFARYYSVRRGEHASELFQELVRSPKLAHWRPLLKQAIASYKRRQYLLVVPSLVLIFEGALAQAVDKFNRKSNPKSDASKRRSTAKYAIERAMWASLEGFIHSLYADNSFGSTPPSRINRHWMMHGRHAPKWNRVNCLRLFQAIHTLAG